MFVSMVCCLPIINIQSFLVAVNPLTEYSELDVNVAAEVVLHARNTQQVNISSRQQPPILPAAIAHPIFQHSPTQLAEQNKLAQVLSALDGPALSSRLGSLQANRPNPALNYASSTVNPTDLSALLTNMTRQNNSIPSIPTTQSLFQGTQPGGTMPNQPLAPGANLASLLAKGFGAEPQIQHHPQQPTYPQLHQIMDQLSRWKR